MRHISKKTFISNFIIIFLSVFIPFTIFSILLTSFWSREIKNSAFETDTTMLSMAAQSFDTVLSDTTQIMALLEFDSSFSSALDRLNANDEQVSGTYILYLNNVWSNTSRSLLSKPYVKSAYLYLEKRPDIVFTQDGVRNKDALTETNWINAYQNQNPTIDLWAESLRANPDTPEDQAESIFLFRRVPILQWDTSNKGVMVVALDRKYFDLMLSNLPMLDKKDLFIFDDKNTQIYSNTSTNSRTYISIDDIQIADSKRMVKSTPEEDYLVSIVNSAAFNWTYVSAVPLSIVLNKLNGMQINTLIFSLISLALCLFLTLFYTVSNYRPIKLMLHMINDYNEYNTIHKVDSISRNEYGFIIYNILQTFIKKQEMEKKLQEEKILQRESSLRALQAQINPHFLYNTLETINWESIDLLGEGNSISQMLLHMSSYLRYITIDSGKSVSLQEDLEYLKKYIAICRLLYEDRIYFTFRIDPSVCNVKISKLLIQPLVENAINHGMRNKGTGGVIRISITKKDAFLKVKVVDNGCGMTKQQLTSISEEFESSSYSDGEHLGLQNVNYRLKLKYGDSSGLKIRSKLNLGTVVSFVLPLADDIEALPIDGSTGMPFQ